MDSCSLFTYCTFSKIGENNHCVTVLDEQQIKSSLHFLFVVVGFQPQDQILASAGLEESSAGSGFGQPSQSFYNSRGIPRGGPRNGRGMMNGYRGSSNGFRGKGIKI